MAKGTKDMSGERRSDTFRSHHVTDLRGLLVDMTPNSHKWQSGNVAQAG